VPEPEDAGTVIEIRDPALDREGIVQEVNRRVARRQSEGAYGADPETLGPETLRPDRYDFPADAIDPGFPGLHPALAELLAAGHLREPHFSSTIPLIGPLIVAVRRFWNWMSTKWYVRPILAQQSELNTRTAGVMSDLAQWHELGANRLHLLEARVAELEARLARLEAEEGP
jgi:hypothetical protein